MYAPTPFCEGEIISLDGGAEGDVTLTRAVDSTLTPCTPIASVRREVYLYRGDGADELSILHSLSEQIEKVEHRETRSQQGSRPNRNRYSAARRLSLQCTGSLLRQASNLPAAYKTLAPS